MTAPHHSARPPRTEAQVRIDLAAARAFFARDFGDALALLPDFDQDCSSDTAPASMKGTMPIVSVTCTRSSLDSSM